MKGKKSSLRIYITAIIALLLVSGGIFAWALQDQSKILAQSDAEAAEAAAAGISAAAEAAADQVAQAEQALKHDLAREHVIAHRGSAGESLEHSVKAYDEAIAAGARYIEQDIVISKDGTLYVSHDTSPSRMTGAGGSFASMTDGQIDALVTRQGEPVLKLADVFDRYRDEITYVIELKDSSDAVIRAFTDLVRSYGYEDRIILQCFDQKALRIVEETWPDMPKMLLVWNQSEFNAALDLSCVDSISGYAPAVLSKENRIAAHKKDKQFGVWTLVSEAEIRQAIDAGVDFYFTDSVEAAISLEESYGFTRRYLEKGAAKTEDAQPASGESDGAGTTILFTSDYQIQTGWDTPEEILRRNLKTAKREGQSPDQIIVCGDYTNDRNLHDYQLSPEDSIGQIRDCAQEIFPGLTDQDILFVQGNHDQMTDSIASSGLHEYGDHLVYILNTEEDFPWKQGTETGALKKVTRASKEMKKCFDELIARGETRPVFIAGHVPLHFTARTSSRHSTGDNLYASLIFDAVNDAAESLDIVYLFGHNHSKGWDCYMGGSCVYKAKGEKLIIPAFAKTDTTTDSFTEETLRFTYLNAGYTGYYMNCGTQELDDGTEDRYHAADETLTCVTCQIGPDTLELTRLDAEGEHALGADGEADPYKGGIDAGLIDQKYYSHKTDSPQIISRKARHSAEEKTMVE